MSGGFRLIACCDAEWGLGREGGLLVRIPDDMRRFRELTLGKTVVYGRKTLQTFPRGLPLEGRRNIVLSRNPAFRIPDVEVFQSVEPILALPEQENAYIIGGGEIYRTFLPYCSEALITRLDCAYKADTFLPSLDRAPGWTLTDPGESLRYEDVGYRFCVYRNKS